MEIKKRVSISNKFGALEDQPGEIPENNKEGQNRNYNQREANKSEVKETKSGMEGNTNEVVETETMDEEEDMDIGDLDLEGIEKACVDVEQGYVPKEQVILLKEEIIREREMN